MKKHQTIAIAVGILTLTILSVLVATRKNTVPDNEEEVEAKQIE